MRRQVLFLGDLFGAGGGTVEASRSKSTLCIGKVQGTGSSANIKGNFSHSERKSIQSVLGYVSETLTMKVGDMIRLDRTERVMVRWMYGVYLKSRMASAELNSRLGIYINND